MVLPSDNITPIHLFLRFWYYSLLMVESIEYGHFLLTFRIDFFQMLFIWIEMLTRDQHRSQIIHSFLFNLQREEF